MATGANVARIIAAMDQAPGQEWHVDRLADATGLTKDQIQGAISNNLASPNVRFERCGPGRIRFVGPPVGRLPKPYQVDLVNGVRTGDTWNILAVTPRGLIAQDQSGAVYSATNPTMLEV